MSVVLVAAGKGPARPQVMRMDRKRIDSSGRTLLIAFGIVAGAFVLSTALAERSEVQIRRAAALIAENSAPSIEHLSRLRTDLRRITRIGDDDLDATLEGSPRVDRRRIDAALASLQQDWARYRALPFFSGEELLTAAAARAKQDLAAAVKHVQSVDAGSRDGDEKIREVLESELQPAANRLDAAVLQLIDFNAARGGDLGTSIRRLGERSVTNAIVLDAICLVLTAIAAWLAWRLGRRYTLLLEQRADELEAFAGRVAHDVVGPLSAASLALDLLARGKASPERAARALEAGRAGIGRTRLIADGLLAFARAGARPEQGVRTDVAEVVAGAFKDIAAVVTERGIALVAEIEGVAPVACNPGVLASLVSNLVRNAVKYGASNASPRIVVRAFNVQDRGGARVRLEVEDNGPGLPAELGARVFEPYVRGRNSGQPGIGLGLATVKKIAVAHGGQVSVRSVPGAGCTFTVELPAAGGPVSAPHPPLGVREATGQARLS
jgi:signal transduction histidine kinase